MDPNRLTADPRCAENAAETTAAEPSGAAIDAEAGLNAKIN